MEQQNERCHYCGTTWSYPYDHLPGECTANQIRRAIDMLRNEFRRSVLADPEHQELARANELAAKYLRERNASVDDRAVLRANLDAAEKQLEIERARIAALDSVHAGTVVALAKVTARVEGLGANIVAALAILAENDGEPGTSRQIDDARRALGVVLCGDTSAPATGRTVDRPTPAMSDDDAPAAEPVDLSAPCIYCKSPTIRRNRLLRPECEACAFLSAPQIPWDPCGHEDDGSDYG